MVAWFSAWIGEFSGRQSYSLGNWVAFAITALGWAFFLVKLLIDIWKPEAGQPYPKHDEA
jgi:hypothetical protein